MIGNLLSVGLIVHWRYIASSQFCNDAYKATGDSHGVDDVDELSSLNNSGLFNVTGCKECEKVSAAGESTGCQSCESILYNQIPLLETFRFVAEDDYLTSDLAEAPYYKWLFMVIHWKHPDEMSPVSLHNTA